MIEDDAYRASTQYRYWSYTPQQLAEIRQQTNELASQKVKAAFRRSSKVSNGDATGETNETEGGDGADEDEMEIDDVVVDTLTVEEELKIVEWGCGKIIEMGEAMRPRVPGGVVVRMVYPFHISQFSSTQCYILHGRPSRLFQAPNKQNIIN
jgi:cyclin H